MNKLKRVKGQTFTGKYNIDWINIIACLLLLLYNLLDLYIKGFQFKNYTLYLLPYIIYPVSQIFYRSNKSSAAIYLFVGLVTVALDINVMGISGIIYMYFSFNEIKSIKYSLFLMAATIISLSLRLYILKSSGAESIVSMLLFLFIFITFYIKVLKDNTNMSKLPEEIKAILKLYCNGYTYQQISITLGLGITPGTVRRKITSMMGKHNIKNDAQLGKWLHRNV